MSSPLAKKLSFIVGAAVVGFAVWHFTRPPAYTPVPAPVVSVLAKPVRPIVEDEATAFAGYAGDAACKACHAPEFDKWATSHHGLAERPLRPDLDKAAFEPPKSFTHGTQTTTAQMAGDTAQVTALGFNNEVKPFTIDRVIGHDPLRQFLVNGQNGRVHTLEATWDPHKNEWFNVYGNEDRKPGEWGHWTGRGMVWNTMCASCHSTRVRKNYDASTDTFHTTMAQQTVSCEACHGPMKEHATKLTAQGAKPYTKQPSFTIPTTDEQRLKNQESMHACALCHARRTELTGDFKPGDNFWDHHSLAIVDHTDIFYPDGQIRDEDYEFSSFMSSRMHAAGVRCVDCHDPHSGKRILPGNSLCMRCHTQGGFPNAPVIIPAAHTFHLPESTGSQCVNCHMPQTTYMQRHPRHDHGFTIPDPLLTKQFNIPNACNKCHQDKDTDWSLAAAEKWYGDKMNRRTRQRAMLMAKGRRGDDDARDGLIAWLQTDDTPYWKASASLLLDRWTGSEDVRNALKTQLQHTHPIVRESAVRSLEAGIEADPANVRSAIEPMLDDAVRNVRVAAAWALRDHLDLESTAGKELLHMLNLNADQPSGQMQLGQFEFARNNLPKAIEHMRRAIAWDPNSPPFHHDLAMIESIAGDTKASIASLSEAIRLNPNEPEYRYKLGLAWNEAGDSSKSIAALREAVHIAPTFARAWYNLGLGLNQQGKIDEALQAFADGSQANPTDASIPYARATILARMGRIDEAKQEVFKALTNAPGMPEALQLREALNQRPAP
jgi:tetratricopeptide (TPR) repeat protein